MTRGAGHGHFRIPVALDAIFHRQIAHLPRGRGGVGNPPVAGGARDFSHLDVAPMGIEHIRGLGEEPLPFERLASLQLFNEGPFFLTASLCFRVASGTDIRFRKTRKGLLFIIAVAGIASDPEFGDMLAMIELDRLLNAAGSEVDDSKGSQGQRRNTDPKESNEEDAHWPGPRFTPGFE